ncbi:MAG: hypothetical protein N3A01_05670, partial [Bacteroidales bacterium]|nr:hypothetical protein [Bacteroidales bacterium]
YYIGTTNYYSPINFSFTGISGGTLRCRAIEGDHPDIYSTDIDPNKTVNIYWKINSSVGGTTNITFNYPSTAVDAIADPNNFKVAQYVLPDASYINPSTTPTYTQTQITGITNIYGDYIIGEKYNPEFVYNANTGNILWSNPDNWIQIRTGTISASTSSNIVTGTSTLFTTELNVGDKIALQSNPTTYLGIVASIVNDNTLILTTNALQNATNASYGRKKLPEINDIVNIGFMPLSSANVNVVLDIDANIHMLQFTPMARSNSVTFNDGRTLNVTTNVNLNVPSTATNTNSINVNNGILNLNGNLIIGRNGSANRIGTVNLINGTINVGTNIVFNSANAAAANLNITGNGRVNLSNTLIINASPNNQGTFNPGTNGIFCYCGSSVGQTVNFNVNYRHLYFNNTSGSGVTIPSNITATNVTGDVVVEGGLFYYNNLSATGNAGRFFRVKNGATFRMTGTATFPTTFSYDFEPNSNVEYMQTTNNLTITRTTYGNLYCIPATNVTQRFPATDITIAGNLIIGGPNGSTLDIAFNDPDVYCSGSVTINSNTTLMFSNLTRNFTVGGNWINHSSIIPVNLTATTVIFNGSGDQQITGTVSSQSFPLIQINKPIGTKVTVTGSTNTLNTASITVTQGEFVLPPTINITNLGISNVTIQANGILNGTNSNITFNGNWTNNGGTFVYTNSTLNFTGGNNQNINGTATYQSFNDVVINKTGNNVTISGSTNFVEVGNYTQYNSTFSSSNGNTTMRVNGNFTLEGNSQFNGTNITNLYLRKNITNNSTGTWTMSQNVYLDGNVQQIISGSSAIPTFTNLTIDNTSITNAIILNKPITINGTLTLIRGQIVTTSTNILSMGSSSSVNLSSPGGNQRLSFIKGPMQHNINAAGTTTRIFPVGKDTVYHRIDLQVTYGAASSTNYIGEFFLSSASDLGWSLPPTLTRVSDINHWEIKRSGGSNPSQAYVTLYFNTNFDGITDFTTLRVAKGDPSAWVDLGGNVIIPATDGAIKSTIPFTSFSKFALASSQLTTNPLPIELAEFKAYPYGKFVKTEWVTYSEYNNDYFVVEKSTDLQTFIEVGKVKGAGFSSVINKYELIDNYPIPGVSYYRLKQVDFDGKYTYSDTVAVLFEQSVNAITNPLLEIYPNPLTSNPLYVKLNSFPPTQEVLIVVANALGEIMYSKVVITDIDGNLIEATDPYDLLSPGIYYVIASTKNFTLNKKLIIRK